MRVEEIISLGIQERLLELLGYGGYIEVIYLGEDNKPLSRPGYLSGISHFQEVSYIKDKFNYRKNFEDYHKKQLEISLRLLQSLDRNDTGYGQPTFNLEPDKIIKAIPLVTRPKSEGQSPSAFHVRWDDSKRRMSPTTDFGYLKEQPMKPYNTLEIYKCKELGGGLMEPKEIQGEGIIWVDHLYDIGKEFPILSEAL